MNSRIADSSPADSYDVFYERLQSGGHWFDDDKYGYVWQPSEAERDESWRPYTDGHWAYTDRGWTWVSNENFGWATYHYGRWAKVKNVGWIWVPGNTWAPAWVSWRQTERSDYVGWAPLPPECEGSPNVKVEGWVDNYYDIGPAAYIFMKAVDLVRPTYRQAILPPQQNLAIIDQTRNVTNITYNNNVIKNYGPDYQQLAQLTNNHLERYQINYQQQARPDANFRTVVNGNQVEVVAPAPQSQRQAAVVPKGARQLQNTQVERGWQNIDPAKRQQLKQAFQQNAPPVPKGLPPQPPPPRKPVNAALGSPAPSQQAQKPGTPLSSSQISAERQEIEAEKAQLEQQKQALLNGKVPSGQPGAPNQKPAPTAAQIKQAEDKAQKQQQADAEKAKQLEAQKAQQADQVRAQQEAQQKQQAAQQQQQQAAAEKARQLEAQKAQQADQIRAQQEVQQKQQAAQQQQQAAAEKGRQLEAQKAQQADQVRAQQEAQQRQQTAQQQQQAAAERAKHPETQKGQKEEEKKKNVSPPPAGQPQR